MISPGEHSPAAPRREDERSVGELFTNLANETSTLVRQEVQLASQEMTAKATRAGKQLVYILAGLLVAVVSVLALLFALIFGLATVLELWKSALLVGIVAAAIAIFAVFKGIAALRAMKLLPEQTIRTLKEDKQWLQQQTR
jgi:hypothetical protein